MRFLPPTTAKKATVRMKLQHSLLVTNSDVRFELLLASRLMMRCISTGNYTEGKIVSSRKYYFTKHTNSTDLTDAKYLQFGTGPNFIIEWFTINMRNYRHVINYNYHLSLSQSCNFVGY